MTRAKSGDLRSLLKGNIGTLIYTRMLLFFAMQMYHGYLPLYVQDLGGSKEVIGFVTSLTNIAALIIIPVMGYVADHWGRVKLIASAFYLRIFTFIIYALSGNWVHVAIGNFYDGFSQYNHAPQTAIMADSMPPGKRATGFAVLNNLPNGVSILGPIVGAFFISTYGTVLGMKYLCVIIAVFMFMIGITRQLFMTETLQPDPNAKPLNSVSNVLSMIKEAYINCVDIIKWTPKNMAIYVLIQGISTFSGAMVGAFWIIFAINIIKLTAAEWGLIMSTQLFFGLIIAIPAGIITDKVGSKKMITLMLFLSLFQGYFFVYYCQNFVQTLALMLYVQFITSFIVPASMAILADMVPRNLRGRVASAYGRGTIGVQSGAGGAGGGYVLAIPTVVGGVVGGYIYALNPAFPWLAQIVLLAVCLVLNILLFKEPEHREI